MRVERNEGDEGAAELWGQKRHYAHRAVPHALRVPVIIRRACESGAARACAGTFMLGGILAAGSRRRCRSAPVMR